LLPFMEAKSKKRGNQLEIAKVAIEACPRVFTGKKS